MSFKKNKKFLKKGFTTIELIVVISIVAIISSIVALNYSTFKSASSLENVSQDIALTIRKAQTSAIGVKGVQVKTFISGKITQFPSFGVSFYLPNNSGLEILGDEKSFIFFADLGLKDENDKKYNYTDSVCDENNLAKGNECLDKIKITTSDKIHQLCYLMSGGYNCYSKDESPRLDIVFSRPYPEASFYFCINDKNCIENGISSVKIIILSSENKTKEITIWNTGQINVN